MMPILNLLMTQVRRGHIFRKRRIRTNRIASVRMRAPVDSSRGHHLTIYMYCPELPEYELKEMFASNSPDWDDTNFYNRPVFLNHESAKRYSRYVGQIGSIFKLKVPEFSIIGKEDSLSLRPHSVLPCHIEGCYPHWDHNQRYVKNPTYSEH